MIDWASEKTASFNDSDGIGLGENLGVSNELEQLLTEINTL